MVNDVFIFAVSFFMVLRGATLATKYAGRLAENFHLSKYTIGFIVVAIVSVLPEAFISINAALKGIPSFGLGVLFGANIADLTLVFAIIIFYAGRGLKIESKILKNRTVYPFLLLLPLILGLDGRFSRAEGLALIVAGVLFYYFTFKDGSEGSNLPVKKENRSHLLMLLLSMAVLLVGSHFTVTSAVSLADYFGVNSILIGMLIVGLGTTMPELFFSLRSAQKRDDSLAIGDILGTVLANATVLVGILAVISPFVFPKGIIYVTGIFMVAASFILFSFMRSGKMLSKKESWMLAIFWVIFALVEFIISR